MDLFSSDFWNSVKDVSTAALALAALYHILASRAARRQSGLMPAADKVATCKVTGRLKDALRSLVGRFYRESKEHKQSYGATAQEKTACSESPQEAVLWGTDPYLLAVRMASQGMDPEEIARRTEIPRGEILLAIRYRAALEGGGKAICGPSDPAL
jgi:hypothetical protein